MKTRTTTGPAEGWEYVIGLEVHTELKTATKLFCGCPNAFGEEPNTSVCPVCLGLPGSLPVMNEQAVDFAIRVGLALDATIQRSQFHRKNYFYPDMPKDYQISQYDVPINARGHLELPSGRVIGIERAHLEEDTGKLIHRGGHGRIESAEYSLIDYNRSGVPLLEIVSAPDIRDPEEAKEYVTELRAILVTVGASDGRMEEGSLRVDANVSVRPIGDTGFRTRVEIKNLNSLRSLVRALEFEGLRQVHLYEDGEAMIQQTRFWDEARSVTGALRLKEEANDYRYFPEPDLPPVAPDSDLIEERRAQLPELPSARRGYLASLLPDLSGDLRETVIADACWPYFRAAIDANITPARAAARCANELTALLAEIGELTPTRFVEVLTLEDRGELGASQVKILLREACVDAAAVPDLIAKLGLSARDQRAIKSMVAEVIAPFADEWERYLDGDEKIAGFLVGQVMRKYGRQISGADARQALVELGDEARKSTD
ncbi:Asp-tRNA(Asn)/Glu-tRNA(Gln) amidotransferase subunit GatB [Ferrimicrobium acidiphilum]|uniref:Asp-tRNA(Asn)/Glu-tRNA(Gln) amidotransferase subunit GatB n=1 Tax=Ferrimicrobium acidiphilum TaxID=121039 RepID=UPI0023F0A088|nr:Asp-tRNA(Asn)/Glu-tRNA(Gln) amidotransferase subunit GatB [Ferrimicrobium acidiphilum]